MLKRVGESRHPCQTPSVVRNQSPYAAVEDDCISGLVIQVFDDSEKVVADVGCPSVLNCPQTHISSAK